MIDLEIKKCECGCIHFNFYSDKCPFDWLDYDNQNQLPYMECKNCKKRYAVIVEPIDVGKEKRILHESAIEILKIFDEKLNNSATNNPSTSYLIQPKKSQMRRGGITIIA